MAIAIALILAAHLLLLWHAARRNPGKGWIAVLFIPVVGALAYLVAEVLFPPLGGGKGAQPALRAARQKEQRRLHLWPSRKAETATPVAKRLKLAKACLARGDHEEARDLLEGCLIYGAQPELLKLLAEARFALEDPAGAVKALERLRAEFPEEESAADRDLYTRARALQTRP